jgi:hypothetical protein
MFKCCRPGKSPGRSVVSQFFLQSPSTIIFKHQPCQWVMNSLLGSQRVSLLVSAWHLFHQSHTCKWWLLCGGPPFSCPRSSTLVENRLPKQSPREIHTTEEVCCRAASSVGLQRSGGIEGDGSHCTFSLVAFSALPTNMRILRATLSTRQLDGHRLH